MLCIAEGFYRSVNKFVVIILLACPLFATADWVEQRLTLEWRSWLTSYLLRAYFANRSFFKLKLQSSSLDNPDQACRAVLAAFLQADMRMVLQHVQRRRPTAKPTAGSLCAQFAAVW